MYYNIRYALSVYSEINRNSIEIGMFAQFSKAIAKRCHFSFTVIRKNSKFYDS